ncbi:phosphate ABC transporter ATPase [cyanobiont of Ornithocercus magnificus]|nr:phosphate ABC transporter ATPase [cyanobiont of Ornithocercus magnificus]
MNRNTTRLKKLDDSSAKLSEPPLLELKHVCLAGLQVPRLNNISLSLHRGERVALLGPSGAGKSSFLEVSCGSLTPHEGCVLWCGRSLKTCRHRGRIGMLWQNLHLIEELTVGQNINTGILGRRSLLWALTNLLTCPEQEVCCRYLQLVGLDPGLVNAPVRSLSGGQRQRVALARVLRQAPDLLLADEPLTGLDPRLVDDILALLLEKSLPFTPETIVVSLHQTSLVKNFDRVVGLRNGCLVLDSSASSFGIEEQEALYKLV